MRRSFARTVLPVLLLSLSACQSVAPEQAAETVPAPDVAETVSPILLDNIAEDYVKLSLEIGTREPGYIDAYYGPPEWQAAAQASKRNLVDLANAVIALEERLDLVDEAELDRLEKKRRAFLLAQLTAARTRLVMLQGETLSFRDEALGLFGVVPDIKPLGYYDDILARLDKMLPGEGNLTKRIAQLPGAAPVIATAKLKPVFDAAIAECRRRTLEYIALPDSERFTMAFVTNKPWGGYNYYQGDFNSKIEINTDLPIRLSRAVDLGCHEGYPGHHVYNMLLERDLAKNRGWVEYQVYPLYSPQSLIAEGSANYGIELAFPGKERREFEQAVLRPLAGLEPDAAKIDPQIRELLREMAKSRFTIAQLYLDGRVDRKQAIALTRKYGFRGQKAAEQGVKFIETYRTYVINYGLGQDMVRRYIEAGNADKATRWARMKTILSEPTLPVDLVIEDIVTQ